MPTLPRGELVAARRSSAQVRSRPPEKGDDYRATIAQLRDRIRAKPGGEPNTMTPYHPQDSPNSPPPDGRQLGSPSAYGLAIGCQEIWAAGPASGRYHAPKLVRRMKLRRVPSLSMT